MKVRGLRGATSVEENTESAISFATRELMDTIIRENELDVDDVASILFTMTPDLTAAFPAKAVRSRPGWQWVPLMCATELNIDGSQPKCIRLLLHINTEKEQSELHHIYLRDAVHLRPDLVKSSG
ncbi:MAG: chorismate mutase [Alicyclobacillaceae bacterium]|nr:chorismate mutase [Alicyclobacillaceae bacterium]